MKYPLMSAQDLPVSLHQEMSAEDLVKFTEAAKNIAYHADMLEMQAWLLCLAAEMDKRIGVKGIQIEFEEHDLAPTIKLHADCGIVQWGYPSRYPSHTSIFLPRDTQKNRDDIAGLRDWVSAFMSEMPMPSSRRSRGALSDKVQNGVNGAFIMNSTSLRDLSLQLALPGVHQREEFHSSLLARKLEAGTEQAPSKPTPRQRV